MKVGLSVVFLFLIVLSSCTSVNNLYVNDPVPTGIGYNRYYIGVGTGFMPKVDSISDNGTVYHQNKLKLAPNLSAGLQYGLGKQTNVRFAVNLPYVITGIGFRGGIQRSFFRKENPFNLAFGTDFGYGISNDSISSSSIRKVNSVKRAINSDFFLPLSYSFSSDVRIILTPRASFTGFYVKENVNHNKVKSYTPFIPSITLGVKSHRIYFEAGAHLVNHWLVPNFGITYVFKESKNKFKVEVDRSFVSDFGIAYVLNKAKNKVIPARQTPYRQNQKAIHPVRPSTKQHRRTERSRSGN